jgi:hypothetical protein
MPRGYLYTATTEKTTSRGSSMRRKSSTTSTIRGITPEQIAATLDIPYSPPSTPRTGSAPPAVPVASSPVVIPKSRRSSRDEPTQDPARRRPSKSDTIVTVIRDCDAASQLPKAPMRNVQDLLAATKITPPRRMRRNKRRDFRSESLQEDWNRLLVNDMKSRDDGVLASSLSHGSLDILLSPPDRSTIEDDEVLEVKGMRGSPSPVRSMSSESMPSLATDDESTASSVPITPAVGRKCLPDRRNRMLSTSEDCAFDHPLLIAPALPDLPLRSISEPTTLLPKSPAKRPPPTPRSSSSSLKSNLTASLRALKNAAQSVSNFTSSSTPQKDFLTRSIFTFSPELTDDKRPPPSSDPPSPALRRYLNPVPSPLVPTDLYMYTEHPVQLPPRVPQNPKSKPTISSPIPCTASIQLQTYRRHPRRPSTSPSIDTATAPPVFASPITEPAAVSALSSEPQTATSPLTRQREPRENSDFLRMVVCEMEMRRKGKIRDDLPGRARIWLPARKMERTTVSKDKEPGKGKGRGSGDGVDVGGGVPRRWIAILADE